MKHTEFRIPAQSVKSLVWDGDTLIDWAAGGRRYREDGSVEASGVHHAFPFDACVAVAPGSLAVVFVVGGTKGLVLDDGRIVREINRSYYFADAYEYPITVFRLPSGRAVLAHCPNHYNRLEIEDLESGEILTRFDQRKPSDFFHSRLQASSDGRYLVSAGWVWHPVHVVRVFDVAAALSDPSHLDGEGLDIGTTWADENSAAFLSGNRLIVSTCPDPDEGYGESALRVIDLRCGAAKTLVPPTGCLGRIVALGDGHLLALHGHPRLIELESGRVVHAWPDIASGDRKGCLIGETVAPPMAVDRAGRRVAVADRTGITIIDFGRDSSG